VLARQTGQSLRRRASDAADKLRQHRLVCPYCKPSERFPRDCCDDGWAMIKAERRAVNTLDVYLGSTAPGKQDEQGVLF
jgi:hypothetical protein